MANRPVRGKTYTFTDVQKLDLDDAPALNIMINGSMHPLQDSHVAVEYLLKNCPEFANSLWRYSHTTIEWIPVFNFVGTEQEALRLVDHEPYIDQYNLMGKDPLWVTPKGSPRPQHY